MKTIYLCGGINKLSDADARDWRDAAKSQLGGLFNLLDPMRRDYRGREAACMHEIISGDLQDIQDSQILLVNGVRPSWGTAMETFYAFRTLNRRVIVVCPDASPSPWLVGHATHLVKSFDQAFDLLRSMI